jgi:hypothetical protein
MTRFKLSQKKVGKLITTFHITDEAGNTIGSVNVPNASAGDLTKHWAGSIDLGERQPPPVANAKHRNVPIGKFSQKAVLRGC